MAAVPDYTTGKLVVTYNGPRGEHKMTFYQLTGLSQAATIGGARNVITQMADVQYTGTVWGSAVWYAAGQNFSVDVDWEPISAPIGNPGADGTDPSARYLGFVGRSTTTGVRKRFFLYNVDYLMDADLRKTVAESAATAEIVAALNESTNNIGAKDGSRVVFKPYGNQGLNDYWVRRDRIGS
jgi:hypothetical protein